MKIEILFPEFCNLFGDMSNMWYLRKCLPEAEFVETPFEAEPAFASEDVGLIYLGPMTERTQERVIEKLRPLSDRIYENEDGSKISGLGIFDLRAKRDMMHRHNSTFLGRFDGEEVMCFKSQFTMAYTAPGYYPFLQVTKGTGLNKKLKTEGIRYKNFVGTYLLGPILILNPCLTKRLLSDLGVPNTRLAFDSEINAAYWKRLKDFHAKT